VAGGVPEPVWPKALDSRALGSAAQGEAEPLAAELLATVAEPQIRAGSQRMLLAMVKMNQQRVPAAVRSSRSPRPATRGLLRRRTDLPAASARG